MSDETKIKGMGAIPHAGGVAFRVSERRTCRAIQQPRSTQRYRVRFGDDEAPLTQWMVALATRYGRYVHRRTTGPLAPKGLASESPVLAAGQVQAGRANLAEGLKVPARQPKRGRLWLNDGSGVRLRPEYPQHVWSYDLMRGRLEVN